MDKAQLAEIDQLKKVIKGLQDDRLKSMESKEIDAVEFLKWVGEKHFICADPSHKDEDSGKWFELYGKNPHLGFTPLEVYEQFKSPK